MSTLHSARARALHPHTLFRAFKYAIYGLLALNIFLFLQEEMGSAREVFGDSIAWSRLTEAFSATIDTAAWVILLLLFELETAVIPDEKLQGSLKWTFLGIKAVAYGFILWAFYGYTVKWGYISDTVPFVADNLCNLVGSGVTWIDDLDQYPPLDTASCAALQAQAGSLVQIGNTQIIGTADAALAIKRLAFIDVLNAATWLVIVALLEIEVLLQLKELLTQKLLLAAKITKGILYAILLLCAVYWGLLGDFLDFWDAFLWLVAFIFIEMNIFQWHEDVQDEPQGAERVLHQSDQGATHAI